MTWSRLDDLYDDHPKVLAAMHMNPLAVALHVTAITASSRRESDGLVDPFWLLARVPDRKRREDALAVLTELALYDVLAVRVVHEFSDAAGFSVTLGPFPAERYIVHDYLDFNPSSAQLQDRRRRDAERKASGRRKESDESPEGVRADTRRTPRGPRGRAGALPHPIPSHPIQEPPLAPPADAGGGQGQPEDASPVRRNSRALGTNPRSADKRQLSAIAGERASLAVAGLASPTDEHRSEWERLRTAMARAVPESTWGIWLESLALAAVDGGELVIDGPDESRSWVTTRFTGGLAELSERLGIPARLASLDEHDGLGELLVAS